MIPCQKRKGAGQPLKAEWEKWRCTMWAHEVKRQAQAIMDQTPAPVPDPFAISRRSVQANWGTNQRAKTRGIVKWPDVDMFFSGSKKSRFCDYASGKNPRPGKTFIDEVERMFPGTKAIYEIGPHGMPIWPALAGKITVDGFWEPLAKTGQVTDALELLSGGFNNFEEGIKTPQPDLVRNGSGGFTSASYDAAIKYEVSLILPKVPWENIVFTLATHFARHYYRSPDEPVTAEMMNVVNPNLGIATLAIAMGCLAINDTKASSRAKDCLRMLLIGSIPLWKAFDAASDEPKSEISVSVAAIESALK